MIRRRVPEVMDGGEIAAIDHAQALRSLNWINRLCGVDRHLARCINTFGPINSVLDLGCGGGGLLAFLRSHNRLARLTTLIGIDRSEVALQYAKRWHSLDIHWISADARCLPLNDESVDLVTCSLFLHHFDAADATKVLAEAARVARHGIVISDLVRSRLAWMLTWTGLRLLSRSWIVHVDGPRSVQAAFQRDELLDLAQSARLDNSCVKGFFPFRMVLLWKKNSTKAIPIPN